jgi:cardiolipin synthase C
MISQTGNKRPFRLLRDHRRRDVDLALDRIAVAALACWLWQLGELMRRGTPIRADTQGSSISAGSAKPRAFAGRGLLHTVLIWLGLALTGCAAGPRPDYPRTPSTAFEDYASTKLGQFFGPAAEEHPGLSGFSLMSQGREAFITRLALADLAQQSLDMQYYIWDGDTTGRIILDHVLKAADRGVRVRLLIDDPYYKANDPVIAALDAHPHVEIRLFNSLTNRSWSAINFVTDFGRVNRRMHNKLMVADNAAAIVGGRNIGDIYYGVDTTANYRDLDVLAVGPIVRDLSGVFDRYWNSASTVPIRAIVDRAYGTADLDAIQARLHKEIAAADYPYPIDQDLDELAARGAELRDDLVWARGRIIADDPASVARGEDSDDVVEFIRWRVAHLDKELLIESPYFVLPAGAQATAKDLHERGVQVRVLTNSLASNDVLPAQAGYAKTRKPLLENGMELYELRPDTDAFRPGWSLLSKGSRAALHTKAMVFDREAVFIGSFNLDPRSAWINTEAGLYIESPELAERLATYMATGVVPANSYHVLLDSNGKVVWETVTDGQTVRYQDEPDTAFSRRFAADLWKILPIESQL